MGVRGLTGFIARHAELYLLPYELHDCNIVIDGDSLSCNLYNDVSGITSTFGGDYDVFYRAVVNFFQVLAECNIEPYVLMDGGYESRKLLTVGKRLRGKISVIKRVNPCDTKTVFPLLIKEVFMDAVRDCNVAVMRCAFEADDELSTLSRKLGCPVLTYDSDFYIYNVQYIPLITLTIKAHTKRLVEQEESGDNHLTGRSLRKNEAKHMEKLTKSNRIVGDIKVNNIQKNAPKKGKTYKFLDCCIYRIEHLIERRSLSKEKLPLLAALLGNDYIARSRFRNFFAAGMGKVGRSRKVQRQQKRIQVILRWLKEQTVQSAMRQILSRLRKAQRKSLKNQMYSAIHGYSNEISHSYDFFVSNYENAFRRYPPKKQEDVREDDVDESEDEEDYVLDEDEEEEDVEVENDDDIEGEDSGEVSECDEEDSLEGKESDEAEDSNENIEDGVEIMSEELNDADSSVSDDDESDNDGNGRGKTSRFPGWFLDKLYHAHLPRYFVNLIHLRKYINSPQIEHFPYNDCNEIALPILIYAFTLLHKGIQYVKEHSAQQQTIEELSKIDGYNCGIHSESYLIMGAELSEKHSQVKLDITSGSAQLPHSGENYPKQPEISSTTTDTVELPPTDVSMCQEELSSWSKAHYPQQNQQNPAELSITVEYQCRNNMKSNSGQGYQQKQPISTEQSHYVEFTYMARRPRVTNIQYTRYGINSDVTDKFNPTQPDPLLFQYVFRDKLTHLDADKLFVEVKRLPKDLQMYFLAIVYWLHKSQHCDLIHLHAILISAVVLRTINCKIPVERNERTFQKRFGKILKKERTVRDTEALKGKTRAIREDMLAQPIPERMTRVPKSDCYLVMDALMKYFHMQEIFKKKFDDFSTIVLHAFAELQSIVFQLYGLNGLLDMPYAPIKMADLFCGVFLYNMYDLLKTRPDVQYYVRNFIFRDSQMMYDFYVYLWEWCAEFVPHWKRPNNTVALQMLNKKSLKKKRQAARKKAPALSNVDPNSDLVDRSEGEDSVDVGDQQFFDLNNKFCEFLVVR
ncbi:protein asteroid [Eurosta solidaginis]|uniref:protein asteroid n=1 Tax=Eurosta solidaginis TaxID=178769 RepID=UPI0035305A53